MSGWNVWPVNAWLVASMKRFRGLWCEYDEVSSETIALFFFQSCFAIHVPFIGESVVVFFVLCIFTSKTWWDKRFPNLTDLCHVFFQRLCGQNKNKHQAKLRSFDSKHHTHPEKYTNLRLRVFGHHTPNYWSKHGVLIGYGPRCWWFWYRITLHIQLAKRSHKSWPQLLGKLKGKDVLNVDCLKADGTLWMLRNLCIKLL